MKHLKHILFTVLFLALLPVWANPDNGPKDCDSTICPPQQQTISGKVVDRNTGDAIPYCNVALSSSSLGTATNELGEFILKVDSLPATFIFSHLNYMQKSLVVSQNAEIVVALEPLTTVLDEVVVSATKKDIFAIELAKKAFKKLEATSTLNHYSHAFYRQKSKNGEQYSEFSEIFYDIRYSTTGIEDWNIVEGRYALRDESVYNRNFTLFSRILKLTQPNTDELIVPTNPAFEVYYTVRVTDIIQSTDSKIAVLQFEPLKTVTTPAFNGEVYVDMEVFDVLKIKWTLSRDDIDFVELTQKNSSWKDYNITYEIALKQDGSVNLIDYIKVDQSFDYYIDDAFQSRSTTSSNLTFYEHYKPTSRKKLGGRFFSNQSDWKKLDKIGYNEQFWVDNPLVKRTPVEEEVIHSFERDGAFSSIFLNSAENIALMTENIADDSFVKELSGQMNLFENYNPVEKIYLHTDKDTFAAGENLWYSAYAVIGPYHQYTTASRVVHVDLIGPQGTIMLSQTHELINGRGFGSLKLPKNLPSGRYHLRSYTQWMRNFGPEFFFTKELELLSEENRTSNQESRENKIDLQFFPEGGHLVAGIAGKVAFKAIDNNGQDTQVKGQIEDFSGKQVAVFSTFSRGAGFFQLLPKKGERYLAILDDGSKYPLPQVLDTGYTMFIDNLGEKSIRLHVQATKSLQDKPFYVVAHMRQKRYYQAKFEFGKNALLRFEIPKTRLPSGILTITLFDENKKPWCERPVFINNQEELVISVDVAKEKFAKRGKIALKVKVTDTDNRPLSTRLSVGITDAGQVSKDPHANNILTHLLLQSDIKGHIANPGLLFRDQKRATLRTLDLVMLTHGWRKINWPEIWEVNDRKKEFGFAKGLVISGKAYRSNGKPLSNGSLNVLAKSGGLLGMHATKTSIDGSFLIPDFNFVDATQIVFNAYDSSKKPVNVSIKLDKNDIKIPPSRLGDFSRKPFGDNEAYLRYAEVRSKMGDFHDFDTVTALDEVVVTEKKVAQGGARSVYGQKPDATIYTADNVSALTVLDLIRRMPSVTVNGNTVSIRNRGTPLWVLDGIPVYNDNPSAVNRAFQAAEPGEAISLSLEESLMPTPAPTYITTMDTFAVERIELLKGPSAAIYGSRGGNGVILIYTKRGVGRTAEPVISPDFTIQGHAGEKEFYSPKYDLKRKEHQVPDYRATLYWNPEISTDENGNATIEFFNSDVAKAIQVSIEGLSPQGVPGSYLQRFGESN